MVRTLLAGALASALCLPPALSAEPLDPDDATEVVETLLGFTPQRHDNPLAAMQGWGALYARARQEALTGDDTAMRLWFLIAFTAQMRGDAALNQSFADDLFPAYQAKPQEFLKALAAAPWLAETVCNRIAAHFGSSDRPRSGLSEFLTTDADLFEAVLPLPAAKACVVELKSE